MAKDDGTQLAASPLLGAEDLFPADHRLFEQLVNGAWHGFSNRQHPQNRLSSYAIVWSYVALDQRSRLRERMSDPIRLTIRAQNAETDAPTVEDLLAQIGDWNSILRGVEEAIAEDGASEIEWRVTGASKNSPLSFELTPFPRRHG